MSDRPRVVPLEPKKQTREIEAPNQPAKMKLLMVINSMRKSRVVALQDPPRPLEMSHQHPYVAVIPGSVLIFTV